MRRQVTSTRSAGLAPRAAIQWLGQGQRSSTLLATVQQLMQAQHVVRRLVPGPMGRACQVVRIDTNHVTLTVPSAAHAAKLRQLGPAILKQLNHQGWAVTDLRVKITMQLQQNVEPVARHGVPMGPTGLQAFSALAETLPPGPLADAVQRLLRHHQT